MLFGKTLKCGGMIVGLLLIMATIAQADGSIVIGINMPLSGERETTGLDALAGLELLRDQVNNAGGLDVGGTRYNVVLEVVDNQSSPQGAVSAVLQLITKKNVLAVVGPNASSYAIPAGHICESFKTPMVSPNSTNPKTTLNRPYVFRACFMDDFQGKVMAGFAVSEFSATKAAVLFNISNAYSRGLAGYFKKAFEAKQGVGSVVAYEDFLTSEKDLTGHIKKIVSSGAEVLFLPQYAYEVPHIVSQLKAGGWDKMILGGSAWESSDLDKCGELCHGFYFSSHFGVVGDEGIAKTFVEQYKAKNNRYPSGYAALAYDSLNFILTAIKGLDQISDSLIENRKNIKDNLAAIKKYNGVTGMLDMNESGNPVKSAFVVRVNESGKFETYRSVSP
jgi:branched-chain amino acid transport system substrate-binding protein